ncbi:TfuA-like protein [Rhizobium terrae]|uniref:TfuA-like protein n=1 Tax=Rhizobium terrae TaxID=2171756 RepID=UPI000E3C6FF3|nr:TfuA-like protein [Rhizobium terrae]
MKTIVFAGPSVFGVDLGAFTNVEFRPPAASGDLLGAVRDGAKAIGLIDGLYGDCAAVWHKEILYALSNGVFVAGAASMGALRATECEAFGMIGLGEIFREYRDGIRSSDADVAVSHAPAELEYRPLTIALVDAEATIKAMEGVFDEDQRVRLSAAARRRHFSARTWRSIVADAGLDPNVAKVLAAAAISVKQADALYLLAALQCGEIVREQPRHWTYQTTLFFENMAARQRR